MENYSIGAKTREKVAKNQRPESQIPAIIYGKGKKNIMLWVDGKKFTKTYKEAGESSLIDLSVENGKKSSPEKVLIHDVQRDPVSDEIIHVDFYRVKMDEKIHANVHLNFIGEAPAVKELGGILVKNIDEVEVGCLPADLPRQIDVDISVLETFEDHVYIKDLQVSDKVTIDIDSETVVALVSAPRTQEELEELDKEVEGDVSQVEGIAEEGEAAEGEEKAEAEEKPEEKKPEEAKKEE